MSELVMQTAVQVLIENAEAMAEANGDTEEAAEMLMGADVATFADAGVLTGNKGLVIRLRDGTEFQLTIVRSR